MDTVQPAICAPYNGTPPRIAAPLAYAGPGAAVLGRATISRGAWLEAGSVIRADGHYVRIGEDFHLGSHATVHIAHDLYPTHIGNRVTAGEGAVIHACEVGDDCVVERGAIVLDGSKIGAGAVLAADAVVYPRTTLEGGWLYAGSPAKPVRQVSAEERDSLHGKLRSARLSHARAAPAGAARPECFVAPSATVAGDVRAGEGVGIWYGCRLDAGIHHIEIGAGTNVQDNTVIRCETGPVLLGPDITVGHNVTLVDCRVARDSLIGIGAVLAPGTIVESNVLVAAGTRTEPGQRLTGGQVWAGSPARPIGPMDARKREILRETLSIYRAYAGIFGATQHAPLNAEGEE